MALLDLTSATETSISGYATLSNPFNTNYYLSIILCTGYQADGLTTQPSGGFYTQDAYSPSVYTQNNVYFTINNLSSGTTYNWYCYAKSLNGKWYYVGYDSYTTASPKTAKPTGFSMSATSSTEVYFSWNSVSGATNYEVAIYSPSTYASSKTTTNNNYYWGNLGADTTYYGYVRAYSSTGGWSDWSAYSYATTPKTKPANFSWTNAKNSGGNFNLTATEWNNLCTRINSFRAYKNLADYSFTSATSNSSFTATMYNQARNAINDMNPSTAIPPYRNSGDTINASDLNTLVSSLNSVA